MAVRDTYGNIAAISGTVTATELTFTELLTGISMGQGMGILIDALEYHPAINTLGDFDAADEYVEMAFCTSNTVANLEVTTKGIIDQCRIARFDAGTAASGLFFETPITHDFFPPLIVATPRLYLGTYAPAGVSGAVKMRLRYRYIKLTSQEYLEIAESFVLVG